MGFLKVLLCKTSKWWFFSPLILFWKMGKFQQKKHIKQPEVNTWKILGQTITV